ncbi:ABC transporter substrate-binding protein [Actinopolymorpha sp. B11F2]|uniref:ABC transporter substrate-binding protein n=1 Tax=Actinopolymorpha sp. B11F2 TaxID=3160862 RepID=UPI0032E4A8B3
MTVRPRTSYRPARRDLLAAGAAGLIGLSTAGCTFFSTGAVERNPQRRSGQAGREAPSLAAQVKAEKLPPLEKRLPKEPMVVTPLQDAGVYGGTWHSAMITQEDSSWLTNFMGYEPLVRWKREWIGSPGTDEIMPNIATSFEETDGGKVFVFKLREGMRWSDGEPVTAEDLRFTYEDVNVYEEMHPDGYYDLWLSPFTQNLATFEQVDEHTVRFVFDEVKPGFLNELAANVTMVLPKHYLQKFHAKYNPDIDSLVQEAELSDWMQLFWTKVDRWNNEELPTLSAWKLVTPLGKGTVVVADRNPYYWKVDNQDRQLPYIDRIECEVLLDIEVEVLKIINGELDMQMRNFATVRNKPVIARNREKGDYRLFTVGAEGVNNFVMGFNQTLPDAQKREVYRNKDFRIGLSHAINRQKIIDTVYAGQGEPWQCAPLEGHPAYDEELGTQYTEYDPDLANEHLDRAGYTQRGGDGIRLRPDGEPLGVIVLVNSAMPDHVDALELIKQDWRAVGVELTISRLAEELYWERVEANQAEASTWTGGDFEIRATQGSNHYYLPSNPRGSSRYGSTWANWYVTDGAEGEEPPPPVKRQLELFDQMRGTYDPEEATALGKQILEITKDQFFYIGICTPGETYGIVKNNFHNVPDSMPGDVGYYPPGPTNPEQYFISE